MLGPAARPESSGPRNAGVSTHTRPNGNPRLGRAACGGAAGWPAAAGARRGYSRARPDATAAHPAPRYDSATTHAAAVSAQESTNSFHCEA